MTTEGAGDPRVLAFYLPQFHPVPENDAWWGRGFTEWTNVVKARPRFPGHYQPHYPSELGFYDLRLPEVREYQASLARPYGIDGFCYYHYWFSGRRILGRPFDEVLASGSPDFPFCLAWANENWTRTWDASDRSILMPQSYDADDDREHIRYLLTAFADPRYMRVDGNRPLFFVYRVQAMPDPKRTFGLWREEAQRAGVGEPYIVKFDTHGDFNDPADFGCDAASEFLPHGMWENLSARRPPDCETGDQLFGYPEVTKFFAARESPPWIRFPCVFPGWDNSPRRPPNQALIVTDNDPESYEWWLTQALERATRQPEGRRFVLINAWNEWGEGAHLEPDERFGRAFLEATGRAITNSRGTSPPHHVDTVRASEPTTFAELYLDLAERFVLLQRQHSQLLDTLERRVEAAAREPNELLTQTRQESAELAAWAAKLRADLAHARRLLVEHAVDTK